MVSYFSGSFRSLLYAHRGVFLACTIVLSTIASFKMNLALVVDNSGPALVKLDCGFAAGGPEVLVLIHGWGGARNSWEKLCDRIKEEDDPAWSRFCVYAVNYPIYNDRTYHSLRKISGEIAEALGQNFAAQRITVLAHSLGGLLARDLYVLSATSQLDGVRITQSLYVGAPLRGKTDIPVVQLVLLYLFGAYISDLNSELEFMQ